MGRLHKKYLDDESSLKSFSSGSSSGSSSPGGKLIIFGCSSCRTHLSTDAEIISKAFQGQHGKAYLFNTVCNILAGPPETRTMTTGMHIVRDIQCSACHSTVGWKYDKAYEESQKYKEGRFILEKALLAEVA